MQNTKQPSSPEETEVVAVAVVQGFLSACCLTDRSQIADRLMKLCSVAAVTMAQANGAEDAAQRLEGTAEFIRKTMPAAPARMERLQ